MDMEGIISAKPGMSSDITKSRVPRYEKPGIGCCSSVSANSNLEAECDVWLLRFVAGQEDMQLHCAILLVMELMVQISDITLAPGLLFLKTGVSSRTNSLLYRYIALISIFCCPGCILVI